MKIALVAPSYNIPQKTLLKNRKLLKNNEVINLTSDKKSEIYNGSIHLRLQNILEALKYPLVWSARGGEGGHHLAYRLKNKKTKSLLVGYSDFTYFHLWANLIQKIPSLHGPMWFENLSPVQRKVYEELFERHFIRPQTFLIKPSSKSKDIIKGRIIGGNLSIICSCIGTWILKEFPSNTILFIEDIDEDLHKIDRMLGHLKECNLFKNVKAVLVGPFVGLNEKGYIHQWSLKQVLDRNLGEIPYYLNFEVGHFHGSRVIPLGVSVEIKKNKVYLSGLKFKKNHWEEI